MKKLLDIGPHFQNTLEPSLQILELGGKHNSLEKRANVMSEAYEYASSMEPTEGHTYILVIAMGAGEYYGPNKNGDYFPEADLIKQYLNFETKYKKNKATGENEINEGALFYKHHKNKAAKGDPWFGTVHKAFYNNRMHRIELLIDVHHSRPGAQELVDKVHSGGDFAVSMGVNIPYDTCVICKNQASKMSDYCDHLKYELGRVRPEGKRVYAVNGWYDYQKHPKALNFFDISYVFRPADKTGFMLKKVAMNQFEEGIMGSALAWHKQAEENEKVAELRKLSEITKYFEGQPIAAKDTESKELKVIARNPQVFENVVSQMQMLDAEHMEKMKKYSMGDILESLSQMGIILTTPEFIQMVIHKKTGEFLNLDTLKQFAQDQSKVFEELAENPGIIDEFADSLDMFQGGECKPEISDIVSDIKESRDLSDEGFAKKAAVSFLRSNLDFHSSPWGDGRGMHDTETVINPDTGRKYVASMGAIDESRDMNRTKDLAKLIGGAALLSGAYSYLRGKKGIIGPAAGIGALALGAKALYDNMKQKDEHFVTQSGMKIPTGTSMYEKRSHDISKVANMLGNIAKSYGPGARTAATFAPGLASYAGNRYYENRLRSGTAGTYRTDLEKNMDNAGRMAYEHPILTAAGGMTAGHLGLNALGKVRKLLGK